MLYSRWMNSGIVKKRKNIVVPQSAFGVCLWKMPDGGFIADGDGNYMCAEGMVGDRKVESQMLPIIGLEKIMVVNLIGLMAHGRSLMESDQSKKEGWLMGNSPIQ